MKKGAILVNTARETLANEAALAAEPDHPFLSTVTALPHGAWLTRETLERSLAVVTENCSRLANGRDLLHRVA